MQRWLRSADVRILRQLVAVHEGIEAMRWLMEERDALASRGSSLTGSLSSLVTVEEHGSSMSPCRYSAAFREIIHVKNFSGCGIQTAVRVHKPATSSQRWTQMHQKRSGYKLQMPVCEMYQK